MMGCNSSQQVQSTLFDQVKFGDLKLKNRFVVAPLTRMRANPADAIPNDLMVEYYSQRASFGLIISECSQISPLSNGFPGSGGIYNQDQVKGWKKVTDAVHAKGGLIINQIWHSGRAVAPSFIGGKQPISSSAVKLDSYNYLSPGEEYAVPHALTEAEIKDVVEEFRKSAVLAKQAGFDGLELHGGNGFLVDQFLRDGVNKRTDKYGGSYENRSRFCLEVIDALVSVFGSGRISVRLTPTGRVNDMYDSNPLELMKYLLGELSKRNLSFVEIKRFGAIEKSVPSKEGRIGAELQIPNFFQQLRPFYNGNLIANDGVSIEEAKQLVGSGTAQAISFGVLSIANPDLPERVLQGYEINKTVDQKTWFSPGPVGYTDYPFSNKVKS